jgi:hypothetical protein
MTILIIAAIVSVPVLFVAYWFLYGFFVDGPRIIKAQRAAAEKLRPRR